MVGVLRLRQASRPAGALGSAQDDNIERRRLNAGLKDLLHPSSHMSHPNRQSGSLGTPDLHPNSPKSGSLPSQIAQNRRNPGALVLGTPDLHPNNPKIGIVGDPGSHSALSVVSRLMRKGGS